MKRITALFFLLSTTLAHAWGPQGHQIVAQIAEKSLTPKALSQVQFLLKGESMSDVSTWADEVKQGGEYANTKSWHFVDIPDGKDYTTTEHNHDGDVVTAITDMVRTLKDPKASTMDKTDALKFLIHFVGDIHQPLHVGRPDDRGGNNTFVMAGGRKTNLHAVWDTYLITRNPATVQQYADQLDHSKLFLASYDLTEFSFSQVISEDLAVRSGLYQLGPNGTITDQYYQKNVGLLNKQLLAGGKRLASILNQIFR